jgi:hypothetical protein
MKKQTGFSITIGGADFDTDQALPFCSRPPTSIVKKGDPFSSGRFSDSSMLVWDEWVEGAYPLDMVAEAIDFLDSKREDFLEIAKLPGIEFQTVNFLDRAEYGSEFRLDREHITILHELGFEVCIDVV